MQVLLRHISAYIHMLHDVFLRKFLFALTFKHNWIYDVLLIRINLSKIWSLLLLIDMTRIHINRLSHHTTMHWHVWMHWSHKVNWLVYFIHWIILHKWRLNVCVAHYSSLRSAEHLWRHTIIDGVHHEIGRTLAWVIIEHVGTRESRLIHWNSIAIIDLLVLLLLLLLLLKLHMLIIHFKLLKITIIINIK